MLVEVTVIDIGWLMLWGARSFSHLEQEYNLGRPETVSFIY
jgi:hypothetical protein